MRHPWEPGSGDRSYEILGMEPGLAVCKANTFPTIRWPCNQLFLACPGFMTLVRSRMSLNKIKNSLNSNRVLPHTSHGSEGFICHSWA